MSQGNKKITRKIPATNKELLIRTGSLIQPAHFKKIPATNYKILMRTGTGTRDSSFIFSIIVIVIFKHFLPLVNGGKKLNSN